MNDQHVFIKFLKESIFARFGVPRAIISDDGSHFCNKAFEHLLKKHGVTHKIALPFHLIGAERALENVYL